MNINDLSLEEKIGQMCMVGINSNNVDVLYDLVRNYKIGGVILYKKNYSSYDEMLEVIKKLKIANRDNKIPLFISIDQEGGRVNRMPNDFKNLTNIYELSKLGDINLIKRSADITSGMLVDSGINRCFSSDVSVVSRYGSVYMKHMQDNNLISVVKHFPGHGVSSKDSHLMIPYIKDIDSVLEKHILPFENAIINGCDAIMVGHLVLKGLTNGLPASISKKFINEYLRKKYCYEGLVITDDIRMNAVNLIYKFISFDRAFSSGSDIILFKYTNDDEKVIRNIVDKVRNGKIEIDSINNSVDRIIKIKRKYRITDDYSRIGCDVSRINREIDGVVNEKRC